MTRTTKALLTLAAIMAASSAMAQNPAASHEDLLKQAEQLRAEEARQLQSWRAEYEGKASQAEKDALLRTAEQQRAQLDATSDRLSDTYDANEVRINGLNDELRQKAQTLGLAELFGLARQSANDNSSILQQSLITTQFPAVEGQTPRDDWMREFSSSRATPTADDLERLWLEIQREMTASGQVAKYRTAVVQPGGAPMEAEVVRIGPFNAMADGQFLQYLPELRTLSVLPRQLPGEFMSVARDFMRATSGYADAVVDPNRGVLLDLYVERPTPVERIEAGETIGYIIITVGILGLLGVPLSAGPSRDRASRGQPSAEAPRSPDLEQPARPRVARVQG
jgi:biopolymer transport protein ExbB